MFKAMCGLLVIVLCVAGARAEVTGPLSISVAPPAHSEFVYPVIQSFNPSTISVPAPAAAGTVVTTVAVQNSDGSAFSGSLVVTGDNLFTTQGMSVVLSRATTAADLNVPRSIKVTAAEPEPTQPSVSVPLQLGGSIACDIGPPVPSIPAEAQAAGFTHCAANWDFSQPLYSSRANWMNCYYWDSVEPQYPQVLWYSGSGGVWFPDGCSTIKQVYDPVGSKNAMQFKWLAAYGKWGNVFCCPGGRSGSIYQANQVGVATYNHTWNNYSGGNTWDIGNSYWETSARMEGGPCLSCGWNTAGPSDVYTGGAFGEIDIFEFDTDKAPGSGNTELVNGQATGHAVNGGWCNWSGCNTGLPSSYKMFDYHTYSALQTSDGKTDGHVCMYVDHTLVGTPGCSTVPASQANFTQRMGALVSAGSNKGTATEDLTLDVQYIRVWSCDAYKTSMCNGTSLVSHPGPQSRQSILYYH